jgi:type IV secretion system protein VirD4
MRTENAQGTDLRHLPNTEKGGRLNANALPMKRLLYQLNLFLSRIAALLSRVGELHHARFARPHELDDLTTAHLPTDSLLLGVSNFSRIYHVKSTKERRELGNLLCVAPTRGGKGLLAISQLLTWNHSVIVNDIKGELFQQTAGYRRTLGNVYVIDPTGIGNQYNPLQGRETEDELYASAKYLLFEPNEGEGRVFTDRAIKMLTQMFLAAVAENQSPFPYIRTMVNFGPDYTAERLSMISPLLVTKFLEVSYENVNWENKFLVSSWDTLSAKLYPLLLTNVVRCLTGSDFTPGDIIHSKHPITVYLRWPEKNLLALTPLIKLIWATLIDEMIDSYDTAAGQDCYPVLLLLDEAANSPIPNLNRYAATVCGRGISLWVAIQALSQLDGLYGKYKADTIRNNMDSKIYYRQASLETAEYVERSLGRRSGYAHSQTLHEGEEASTGLSEHAIPLMTSQDINQLGHDEIITWHSNRKPFRASRMDWRAFPILRQRRAITPPQLSALPQLEESLLPSPWRREENWPLTPIDPDAIN